VRDMFSYENHNSLLDEALRMALAADDGFVRDSIKPSATPMWLEE